MEFLAVPLSLILLWPFHKHQPPAPQPPVVYITLPPGEPVVPDKACTHDAAFGWELRGPDGATGYSATSCQEAFEDWQKQPANTTRTGRS